MDQTAARSWCFCNGSVSTLETTLMSCGHRSSICRSMAAFISVNSSQAARRPGETSMQHGKIIWEVEDSGQVQAFNSQSLNLSSLFPVLLPTSAQPLSPHDEAIFLLHTAAEIEHSLLVQYLYAT